MRVADDCFRCGSAGELLSLAIDHNSLARYSKRTQECCAFEALSHSCRLSLFGFRVFSDLVRGSFQLSLTLLLRYRSQVVFTVGSLCLPDSRAISNARYSGYQALRCLISPTGLSPSVCPGLPPGSAIKFVQFPWSYNTTFPFPLGTDSVCRVPCSIAFTYGISIDFFSSPY